ncbi:bifunctional phosphopantothenoylcysteine decarboxylase/phosphopantothenate--cysteine ligase CoaBC [Pseudalkalibacillus caeni]|uniref:Coenzyme A biosynthesis bifunctional protein CoaBC n=1 Tax=Exobacillus caeni TaxID=2574798 RepID=A0A5R9F9S5_9BACL|nr:bifunctional phosphopantothenoylcysteine decarboxylase/phosphopantothenate--cysteine ligase CoaBC [Pseudalkalibacillus caeni]TLS37314.1 bifunctional phosphopantothenoylcysteine decarboxylase/phosphopantothenate--cysteine ligase CoaBC [Pseudalkalibacillus caeni]
MVLKNKRILLCVTGGIAVFKAAGLASKLYQEGAEVKVMMTDSAREFVTPLTFQTLSRNTVYIDTFDEKDPARVAHIDVADWAEIVIVAPATANSIGKLASGIADDMVSTTLLATTAPVLIAPAMNVHMYEHPAVNRNMKILASDGYRFIEPGEGLLACGYVGKGRLAEPEEILSAIKQFFLEDDRFLEGKKVLVTAGPTREAVDPVRYFTNHSSGKMGFAIAEQAASMGAEVTLIAGPVNLETPPDVERIDVSSAHEMYEAVIKRSAESDIIVKAAAVADYRPKTVYGQKLKKQNEEWSVEMERTIDILKTLGKRKPSGQVLIGFAAESERVEEFALGKLEKKNLDMVCANNITQEGAGFSVDSNILTLYKKDGSKIELPLQSKKDVAIKILHDAVKMLKEKTVT